jgi:SAM-dependent methyltransferase
MDMLRATGRRSDAHIARYDLAARFVRDDDTVLDAACGLGYGTALLHDSASNAFVTGLDLSESVIAYARATFGSRRPRTAFEAGDVMTVRARPDATLDLVVSFETLEHIEEPDAFVAEVARVLKPGGRLICSIPNRWVDHTGRDPNPFHLHVFDLERLTSLLQAHLRIDHTFAQFAGGGMKHVAAARRFVPVPPGDEDDAEWWVAVATKGDAASGDGERPRFQRDRVDLLAADCRRHERALHTLQEQHADVTAQLDRYRGEHEVLTYLLNRRRERIIARALTDARGVAIFGAGEGGRQAATRWRAQGGRVAVFTDNRASLWGTTLADVPIVPPATLPVRDVALIVVASSIGAADIATQLEGMGLCRDVDFMTP